MPCSGKVFLMDRHEAVTRAYPIPGQTWPAELCWLYDTLAGSMRHVEVGVYCGRSLFASCGGMSPTATVLAVDVEQTAEMAGAVFPHGAWVDTVRAATTAGVNASVEVDLRGSLTAARARRGELFDSVFLDASHHYADIVADILEWRPLLRPGGILCGHDYSTAFPGIMDAVNELCPGFQVVPNTRIWWVIPSKNS